MVNRKQSAATVSAIVTYQECLDGKSERANQQVHSQDSVNPERDNIRAAFTLRSITQSEHELQSEESEIDPLQDEVEPMRRCSTKRVEALTREQVDDDTES